MSGDAPAHGEPLIAGKLFTVVVESGSTRWGIPVRAGTAEGAVAIARQRGHCVVSVREAESGQQPRQLPPGQCVHCGYNLARLHRGDAGEVLCPECGTENTPIVYLPPEAAARAGSRLVRMRLGCLGIMALFALLLWLMPLLLTLL